MKPKKQGPRYVRVWLVQYRIDGKWQADGEWRLNEEDARHWARDEEQVHGWRCKVTPLDVPASVFATKPMAGRAGR